MKSVYELRLEIAGYFFCEDDPRFLARLGGKFIELWDKLNALATRNMTEEEWRSPSLGNIDKRPILTEAEYGAILKEACALSIETGGEMETDIEKGIENDFE